VARGGKVSVVQVATDAFGNALGNAIGGSITTQTISERQAKGGSFTTVPLNLSEPGFTALSFTAPASSGTGDVIDNYSNQAQGFGENPNAPQRSLTSYVAQRGDTLSGITGGDLAQVGLIASANGLRGSAIQSGQQLIIPDIGDYTGQQQNTFARVGGQIYAGDNAVIAARQTAAAEREAGYLRDPATGEIASFADLSRRSRAASDAADNASAGAARDRINSLAAASGQQLVPYDPVARAYAELGTVNRLNTALLGPFGLGGALARFNGQDENSIAQVNEVGNAAFGVVAAVAGIPSSGPISVAPRSFNGSFLNTLTQFQIDGASGNNTARQGNVTILDGAIPDVHELRASSGLANAGYDTVHLPTANSQGIQNQRTADLLVDGIGPVDVYTPKSTSSENSIIRAIEAKSSQASGVLIQTDITETGSSSIANRLFGKPNAQNIQTLFFQKPDGTIIRINR
jgi:LysM repeat protein